MVPIQIQKTNGGSFLFHRGSLLNVYFPSVTLCNINQGRLSLFHQFELSDNETLLNAVLMQAYFGSKEQIDKNMLQKGKNK